MKGIDQVRHLKITSLWVCLLVSSCGGAPLTRDQYKTSLNIEVTFVEDFFEVERQFGFTNIAGLSVWGGDTCFIFVTMPADQADDYAMNTMGHELLHCVLGDFHK